ncbi:hypothetical protein A2U01_0065246, partial [Trifolium medium]|nr:hypothetical protein [Trifolium medium]
MGHDLNAWCAYHRCKGHDIENCFRLRDLIEDLIRSGHLRKFLEDAAKGHIASQNRKDTHLREIVEKKAKVIRAGSPLTQLQEDSQEEASPTPLG